MEVICSVISELQLERFRNQSAKAYCVFLVVVRVMPIENKSAGVTTSLGSLRIDWLWNINFMLEWSLFSSRCEFSGVQNCYKKCNFCGLLTIFLEYMVRIRAEIIQYLFSNQDTFMVAWFSIDHISWKVKLSFSVARFLLESKWAIIL